MVIQIDQTTNECFFTPVQHTVKLSITGTSRREIREGVVKAFLEEEPGRGNGDLTSFYTYEVETLADGKRVLLERPAILNKGFDMEIHVSDTSFPKGSRGKPTMPTHGNIIDDLEEKQAENPTEFEKVRTLIERIYNCESVSDNEMRSLNFNKGYPIEMMLKTIKWMFIEQDVTYWNWSGRNKFYLGIQELY